MSQKLFTLIYGDQVRAAPGTKVIPAAHFSALQEAADILRRVTEEAQKYRLQVAQESEIIKEQAFKEGYAAGFEDWTAQVADLEVRLEQIRKEMQQAIIPIALRAAKKIVGREMELSQAAIVDIVAAQLKAVTQHKKITIYVNKEELDILEKNRPRLRELFENLESLSIRPRSDILAGGCIIETEVGIINAQMDHRWQALEKAFEALLVAQKKQV